MERSSSCPSLPLPFPPSPSPLLSVLPSPPLPFQPFSFSPLHCPPLFSTAVPTLLLLSPSLPSLLSPLSSLSLRCKFYKLKNTLNLHPASGIQPWEEKYPEMAKAMGIDPNVSAWDSK